MSAYLYNSILKDTINVECTSLLYDFNGNLTLTVQPNANDACSGSLGGRKLVHGKVRGTVDGQFKNGDYIFTTNTLGSGVYTKLDDGYWQSLASSFPEATQGTLFKCSFKSTDGVISEVADC